MIPQNLLEETIKLLNERDRSLTIKIIAADLNFSISWLHKLAQNNIPNPGVNQIIKLHNYLIDIKG